MQGTNQFEVILEEDLKYILHKLDRHKKNISSNKLTNKANEIQNLIKQQKEHPDVKPVSSYNNYSGSWKTTLKQTTDRSENMIVINDFLLYYVFTKIVII